MAACAISQVARSVARISCTRLSSPIDPFSMLVHHWADDGMVKYHRRSLSSPIDPYQIHLAQRALQRVNRQPIVHSKLESKTDKSHNCNNESWGKNGIMLIPTTWCQFTKPKIQESIQEGKIEASPSSLKGNVLVWTTCSLSAT